MNSEFKSEKSTKLKNQYKKKIKKLKKKLAKAEDIAADNEDTIAQLTEKLAALSIEARKKDQEIDNLRRLVIDLDAALLSSDQKKGKSRGEQMNPLETEMPHDLQADLITFD
jgi:chromosome segregation ATPase